MSDVRTQSPAFLSLYECGEIAADRIDDFIDAWHESGDDERRSLAAYLGMTDEEYDLWFVAPQALPLILTARHQEQSLRDLAISLLASLNERQDPTDRSTIHRLGHWLNKLEAP